MKIKPPAVPEVIRKASFAPVVNAQTRILILGSLPGDASLAQQQYYAHPQNRFWQLIAEVFELPIVDLPYAERLHRLLQHEIGLWDVIAKAQRRGSLDSQIRERDDNDLCALLERLPHLHTIAFNGATASKIGLKILGQRQTHYHILPLPSSSPAYTLAYPQKLQAWLALRANWRPIANTTMV